MAKARLRETDLYDPVRRFLTDLGYDVQAEVNGCDVAAVKDGVLIIVELKLSLTVPLLVQAVQRQKAADEVYVAVPRPIRTKRSWLNQRGILHLLRRLGLGLLLVSFTRGTPRVQVALYPKPVPGLMSTSRRDSARSSLLREISGRSAHYNVGGSTRRKLMTAYREQAIHVACRLAELGPSSARVLRTHGTGEKTYDILSDNYYGWFTRVSKGVYDLTDAGREALIMYADVASLYMREQVPRGPVIQPEHESNESIQM